MNSSAYYKSTLPNGLRLTVCPMPHLRSISMLVFIGAGSRYESDAEAGVSHFIEHLYFKGTKHRPTSKEISETIESIGGIINAGTDKEMTSYWCKVADQHFPVAIDLISDILHNSRLDPADIEKERQIIIEEINMSLDLPQFKVDLLIDESIWKGQPMGRDVAGSKESVSAITREQMTAYIARRYTANNTVVSITGNITMEKAQESISKAFGWWRAGDIPKTVPTVHNQSSRRVIIETKDSEQAHICLGLPAVSILDPDRYPVGLLSIILGEGMSSRLFLEIRERLGLAYDIRSYTTQHLDTGSLIIYAGVDPKKTSTAVTSILEQLALTKDGIPEVELTKAKELAKGRLLLRMEDSRNVAGWIGAQELLTGRIMSIDEVITEIEAVTTEDIKRVANLLFTTGKLNLAVVGPVKNRSTMSRLLKL
ncbi:MAG: pitrilysin family protein [Chloroflexota bacterium]